VHDPHVTTKECDEATEAAIAEACVRLRLLAEPARSRSVVSWNDPNAADPRDLYEAAVEFVIALLMDKTADEFLGADAPIVRKAVLPALRCSGVCQSIRARTVTSFGIAGLPPWSRLSASGTGSTHTATHTAALPQPPPASTATAAQSLPKHLTGSGLG
jgi:hypothetical protein